MSITQHYWRQSVGKMKNKLFMETEKVLEEMRELGTFLDWDEAQSIAMIEIAMDERKAQDDLDEIPF